MRRWRNDQCPRAEESAHGNKEAFLATSENRGNWTRNPWLWHFPETCSKNEVRLWVWYINTVVVILGVGHPPTALPHFAVLRYDDPFVCTAGNIPEGFSLETEVIRTPGFGYRAGLDLTILITSCIYKWVVDTYYCSPWKRRTTRHSVNICEKRKLKRNRVGARTTLFLKRRRFPVPAPSYWLIFHWRRYEIPCSIS